MKKDVLEFIKANLGKPAAEHLQGFGAWLNGKVLHISDQADLELEFEVREDMLNPLGTIHGGALAAILDEVMGMQLFLKSNDDDAYFALNISVDFIKNAKFGEKLKVVPHLVRLGRKTATLRADIYNETGLIVAQASSNFLKLGS
jgi:acyl-coenzyme A thioesterase 13